jgi:hypothetical protein
MPPSHTWLIMRGHQAIAQPGCAAIDPPPAGLMMARLRLKMPEVVLYGRYTMPVTSDTSDIRANASQNAAGGNVEVVCDADI